MSHDSHFAGDPATFADTFEDVHEIDCGDDCGWTGEIGVDSEIRHDVKYLWGDYVCPNCGYKGRYEGEVDLSWDYDD